MDIAARLRSDGRVTIPREVREALAIEEGDQVVFRVDGGRVVMSSKPDLLDLAGSVDVPPSRRGKSWDEILRETHRINSERLIADGAEFWHPLTPDELIRASGVPPFTSQPGPDGGSSDTEEFLDSIFGDGEAR